MSYVRDNVFNFYSKYREFRAAGKYTDVTIECDGETFECHRLTLASTCAYFDTMFSGNFVESKENGVVVLQEVDAETFAIVLEFIYTGDVKVNSDNFYSLLLASEYLQFADLENMCVRFAREDWISKTESIFDILSFVHRTGKSKLLRFLGQDIRAQWKILSRSEKFLKMPYDDVCALFDLLLPIKREVLCASAVRWIDYRRRERRQYFGPIFEKYLCGNMPTRYNRFFVDVDVALASSSAVQKILDGNQTKQLVGRSSAPTRGGTLCIYVKNCMNYSIANIFSVNELKECFLFDRIELRGIQPMNVRHWIRNIVLDDFHHIYSLQYGLGHPEIRNQSFTLYTLADVNSARILKSPPLIFGDVSMCTLRNSIYINNRCLGRPPPNISLPTSAGFDEEEIRRGIYLYNCEVDKWFPVPPRYGLIDDASIVRCDDLLFSVGGKDYVSDFSVDFQSYDPRVGIWEKLPGCEYFHIAAGCCVFRDKIYVCGGLDGEMAMSDTVERYDPIARKWERLANLNNQLANWQAVPFLNEIWAVGNFVGCTDAIQTSVEIYNPDRDQWRTSTILVKAFQANSIGGIQYAAVDCLVV